MSTPNVVVTGAVATEHVVAAVDMAKLEGTVADVTSVAPGAVGRAVRVASLLALAEPAPEATHCTVISAGGDYRASIPLEELAAGGWLAFERDGAPLPAANGGPFRLTVARGSTLCWNVKDVARLELTTGPVADDVPENPPH